MRGVAELVVNLDRATLEKLLAVAREYNYAQRKTITLDEIETETEQLSNAEILKRILDCEFPLYFLMRHLPDDWPNRKQLLTKALRLQFSQKHPDRIFFVGTLQHPHWI